jgi:ATP-dependent DNA helicase RecG
MEERSIELLDALALVEREESHFWDHKSAQSSGAVLQKIGSALANSDGGEFIVGIEDWKMGTGLDRWRGYSSIEAATPVLDAVARDIAPPVPYSVEFLTINGREELGIAVLVQIRKSENVHCAADSKVYVRRGASTTSIAGQAITDLSLSKGARSYEDQLLKDYTADDLELENELDFFLQSYSPSTSPSDFVRKQRLIDRNSGQAKVASAILYAESPPAVAPKRCSIKIARYNTRDENPRREHLVGVPLTIDGPARVVIEETLRRVTEIFESVPVLKPDGTMAPVSYPPEALKEIVVNAVIHRDYNISDDILVSVLNNRVEVRSPGALPGHMTLENLLKERFSRNPTVVRLLNKYPDPPNKDIGEGLRTVIEKMAEAKLKAPKFRIEGGYFIAELGHTPLARPQEIVMEYLESHSEVTNSIARSLTGITSENAMKEIFYSLRNTGKIERVPGKVGNRSAWRLVNGIDDDTESPHQQSLPCENEHADKHPGKMLLDRVIPERLRRKHQRRTNRPGRIPGRNEECSCGSGQKFKRCHGRPGSQQQSSEGELSE